MACAKCGRQTEGSISPRGVRVPLCVDCSRAEFFVRGDTDCQFCGKRVDRCRCKAIEMPVPGR